MGAIERVWVGGFFGEGVLGGKGLQHDFHVSSLDTAFYLVSWSYTTGFCYVHRMACTRQFHLWL